MPVNQLSDVIYAPEWSQSFINEEPVLYNFLNSGIVGVDSRAEEIAKGTGIGFLPFLNLDYSKSANISSDDPSKKSSPLKNGMGNGAAVALYRNQSWAEMDLSVEISSIDPVAAIRARLGNYWTAEQMRIIASILVGTYGSNIKNNSGDMVYEAKGTLTSSAIIKGRATMGDASKALGVICMHSAVKANLDINNQIASVQVPTNSTAPGVDSFIVQEMYQGYKVIVSDEMPLLPDGKFLTAIFGNNFFRYGDGNPLNPISVAREEDAGNGSGMETLFSRRTMCIHPNGFSYSLPSFSADGSNTPLANPSDDELKKDSAWSRTAYRKAVPLVFITTEG
ncbi:hypothetical protein [Carnimonas bestiolae]|uniref:hypothetical protein n=1 Tax=Carnimonas bestiolae TaxID=3402172 RepID=UPI003EDB9D52